ncbi:MAG TPA: hypothetical protein DIW30_02840 [Bacteroidales bacterium]|nr:hypothetical protein [Bacteroidales bacterium]
MQAVKEITTKYTLLYMDANIELSLLDAEEKEELEYIWNLIPEEDKRGMSKSDVLLVLDLMDDFLNEKGLLEEDEQTGEVTYLEGEVDETEQLEYLLNAVAEEGTLLTRVQLQLILDAEMQYGLEKGWYEDE